ncbi:hypothetical protein [Actinobacillus pleuropneumoniae]|uniref:hypothetical protein n=1 Tax=Actinobacillus pleuropneumoniae TaxID=715 RepID=UPI003B013115
MKKMLLIFSILGLANAMANATTYTPEELKQMVANSNYPAQAPAQKETLSMFFNDCKIASKKLISDITPYYPVEIIVNTSTMYSIKAWTNDAAMTITCADNKLTITTSPYI